MVLKLTVGHGSSCQLDLLESHEAGRVFEWAPVLLQTQLQDFFEVGLEFIQGRGLGMSARNARHDADVEVGLGVELNVCRQDAHRISLPYNCGTREWTFVPPLGRRYTED